MNLIDEMPVPTFFVSNELEILSRSKSSVHFFSKELHFIAYVDEDSRKKFLSALTSQSMSGMIELNLKTNTHPISLFHLFYQKFEHGMTFVCIHKEPTLDAPLNEMRSLKQQLEETDFQKHEAHLRKKWLPHLISVDADDLKRLSLNENKGSLADIPKKVDNIIELISFLRPDLIEIDRSEYLDMMQHELDEVATIAHFLLALTSSQND